MWKRLDQNALLDQVPRLAVLLSSWVDSRLVVCRLPLIPFGDTVLGFKSEGGWLSWNEFWLLVPGEPGSGGLCLDCRGFSSRWAWPFHGGRSLLREIAEFTRKAGLRSARSPCVLQCFRGALIPSPNCYKPSALLMIHMLCMKLTRRWKRSTAPGRKRCRRAARWFAQGQHRSDPHNHRPGPGEAARGPNLVVPALIEAFAEKDLRYVVTVTLGELGGIDGG